MKVLKFWNPESGAVGGLIMGAAILVCGLLIMPAIVVFFRWWFGVWGV